MRNTLLSVGLAAALGAAAPAHAAQLTFTSVLSGAAELPANLSPATGFAELLIDTIANTMEVQVNFSGLLGNTTASHIHCCTLVPEVATAGVATQTPTFIGFPSGVKSGAYDHVFDLTLSSTWNASFITQNGGTTTGAEAALIAGLQAGKAYLNVHTTFAPGGEIRGFLLQQVPEPMTLGLLAAGLAGLFAGRRRAMA